MKKIAFIVVGIMLSVSLGWAASEEDLRCYEHVASLTALDSKFDRVLPQRWQDTGARDMSCMDRRRSMGLVFDGTKRGEKVSGGSLDATIMLITGDVEVEKAEVRHILIEVEGTYGHLYEVENSNYIDIDSFSYRKRNY